MNSVSSGNGRCEGTMDVSTTGAGPLPLCVLTCLWDGIKASDLSLCQAPDHRYVLSNLEA